MKHQGAFVSSKSFLGSHLGILIALSAGVLDGGFSKGNKDFFAHLQLSSLQVVNIARLSNPQKVLGVFAKIALCRLTEAVPEIALDMTCKSPVSIGAGKHSGLAVISCQFDCLQPYSNSDNGDQGNLK